MNRTAQQIPLVVIGGWGVDAAMLLPVFERWPGEIHLVSLTDAVMTRCGSIADVAAYLLDRYPCPSVWAGWSQGAQVAMAAASRSDLQVSRVITLAGFPRFVAAPDWPVGMSADIFDAFRAGISSEAKQAWRRFQNLLIHGSEDHSQARQELMPWVKRGASVSPANLVRGLEWLESEDQVALWREVRAPALHLLAERDAVVRPWAGTFSPADTSKVVTVPGMTHWPRGQALTFCRDAIHRFALGREGSWQL